MLSFSGSVEVIRPLVSDITPATVAERLLRLRGHGVTRLADALKAAGEQLARARARRRVVILLSDCRSTDDDGASQTARALPELIILAPADDHEQAAHLAGLAGARWGAIAHPLDAAAALDRLLTGLPVPEVHLCRTVQARALPPLRPGNPAYSRNWVFRYSPMRFMSTGVAYGVGDYSLKSLPRKSPHNLHCLCDRPTRAFPRLPADRRCRTSNVADMAGNIITCSVTIKTMG